MRLRVIAVLVVLGLIAAGCGNSKSSKAAKTTTTGKGQTVGVDQPGVTDTEIRVGGIASINNPLNFNYGGAFDGVEAYFEMVNSTGGIYGRKLKVVAKRDDQLANGKAEAEGLLAQDNVFAALPIAELLFTASDTLAKANIPTFGWNVNKEWTGPPNFFEQEGALCFDCPGVGVPWLAKELGKKKIGLLAYGVEQSSDCAKGTKASFDKYPVATVAYDDLSLPFSSAVDFSTDVQKMKDAGVDMVTTCMDQNGVLGLTREMKKQGLDALQYLPNAYDHDFMNSYGDLFEGSYVRTRFAPFETKPQPPGLKLFDKWMKKTGKKEVEISYVGWIDADMFVTGLKAAGPNFTRQKVIDELNKLTDYDAGGILPGLDWTKQHGDPHLDQYKTPEDCSALTKIVNKKFEPVFTQPGKPFFCVPDASRTPTLPDKITNKA
jgi:ABC-type branched-subunit amino acid transport system substrate-binding protein